MNVRLKSFIKTVSTSCNPTAPFQCNGASVRAQAETSIGASVRAGAETGIGASVHQCIGARIQSETRYRCVGVLVRARACALKQV